MQYVFQTKLWEYGGEGSWVFVTMPKEYADEIKMIASDHSKAFGSVHVHVTIGETTWKTSLFPDTKTGSYLLPIKRDVRKKEQLAVDSLVNVKITLGL